MPLLLCRRADLRFALDSTGLTRVLSADEIAAHSGQALLTGSLLPCDPAILFDNHLSIGSAAAPAPANAGLLYRHGDLGVLVSVDRVDRPSPKDLWETLPLPRSLRAATADLISDVACRRINGRIDLVPRLDLAALWDDAPPNPGTATPRPLAAPARRSTGAGLLHWPLTPGCPTHLAVSLKHVCELASEQQRLTLPGLPPTLPGLCLWHDRLIALLDPRPLFAEADSFVHHPESGPRDPRQNDGCHWLRQCEGDHASFPPLPSDPPTPGAVETLSRSLTLIIATEQPDEPLALILHTLPQRLRQTADCRPVPLTAEHPDPLLYGRFDTPRGPLLLPAWHRTLTHALLATPEPAPL